MLLSNVFISADDSILQRSTMLKAPLFSVFLLIVWGYCRADENNCTYTIVTSHAIKAGRPHQFSVTTTCEVQTNFILKAWIANTTFNSSKKIFNIKTGITKIYSIVVPKPLGLEVHFFCVEASGGLTFYENRSVRVERKQSSLFIQTDKAIYKPGDRVLFRVLALNPDIKPSKFPVNVTIHDPKANRIYQSLNLQTKNGIASGKLPLSKSTILGRWTIVAKSKGESKSYRFEVKEYVLPKFKVELRVPERYHINAKNPTKQDNLSVAVNARYTYGQPLKGVVLISIKYNSYYHTRGNTPTITKTIKLENGHANFTVTCSDLLDLIPCFYGAPSLEYQTFEVQANVTETVTGVVISERTNFVSRSGRYSLETDTKGNFFKPGFPFKIMFTLKQYNKEPPPLSDLQYDDGSPRNIPVVVNMGFGDPSASTLEQRFLTNLTQNGQSFLSIETNSNIKSLRIEAAYFDEYANETVRSHDYVSAFETRDDEQLQLDLDDTTKEAVLQAEKATTFTLRSTKPITKYQYQFFAKESLFVSQTVTGKNSTLHKFVVNASKDLIASLAPRVLVVASYVNAKGELVVDSIIIPVVNYFINEVELRFSKNLTNPSDKVRLDIHAGKRSTVALLAVDESVRLLKTGNDITKEAVSSDLWSYGWYGGPPMASGNLMSKSVYGQDTKSMLRNAGIIIMTNNYINDLEDYEEDSDDDDDDDDDDDAVQPQREAINMRKSRKRIIASSPERSLDAATLVADFGGDMSQPRTEFPETWIWTDMDITDNGSAQLSFKVPDTITSWVLSAFAVSEKEGLGVADPVKMTVFKSMFVSLNLPYSVVRGEEFALVATVFNYLEDDLEVEVSLANSTHFRTRSCGSTNLFETFEGGISKRIQVQKKDSEGVHFWIVPTSVGLIPIEVKASAGKVVDIIRMDLLVKPEGLPQSYSMSFLIGSSVLNESHVNFPVTLPPETILVPGSVDVEVSVIGNIFANTMENIQNLVKLPAACGEQNIITFAPNVYILNFLSASGVLDNETFVALTNNLLAGFGQQLTFQRHDGSYSAFGDKDDEGSVWLSAFVCKSFRHSKTYLNFESKMVTKTLRWILSHQNSDGSFSEPPGSKIIHSKMQGGSSAGLSLTAYVLIALQENIIYGKEVKNFYESIKNATHYLEQHYQSHSNDTYTLSIITYSFHLVKSRHFDKAFVMFERLANRTSESIHWKTQAPTTEHNDAWKPFHEKPLTYDIEATSYALLIYTAQGNANSLLIAKWLIAQQNEAGGYRSTQDTVIALEALSKFAWALFLPSNYNLKVFVESDVEKNELVGITKDNAFLLQTVQLPGNSTTIKVSMKGKGYAVAQVRVKYNVKNIIKHPLLELNVSSTNSKGLLKLGVSTRWLGKDESGMVIMEVEMPTGWDLEGEDQLSLELKKEVSKVENKGSKFIFYLNELTATALNLELLLENRLSIFGAKPALVKVYQYYDPDTTASAFYSVTGKQTWLTACPECCS